MYEVQFFWPLDGTWQAVKQNGALGLMPHNELYRYTYFHEAIAAVMEGLTDLGARLPVSRTRRMYAHSRIQSCMTDGGGSTPAVRSDRPGPASRPKDIRNSSREADIQRPRNPLRLQTGRASATIPGGQRGGTLNGRGRQ